MLYILACVLADCINIFYAHKAHKTFAKLYQGKKGEKKRRKKKRESISLSEYPFESDENFLRYYLCYVALSPLQRFLRHDTSKRWITVEKELFGSDLFSVLSLHFFQTKPL